MECGESLEEVSTVNGRLSTGIRAHRGGRENVIHKLCKGWGQKYRTNTPVEGTLFPQSGDTVGIDGAGVTKDQRERCWDLMRLVRSVTWLNRLRRSAISWRILRSACMTVV